MKRRDELTISDMMTIISGALVGAALGFVISEELGRINSARIRRAAKRLRGRDDDATVKPGRWGVEDAERLEARVLDALNRHVVLARRAIRVAVLGLGLVELTGRVSHTAEVALAGDVVQEVEGVRTVLNHLLVEGVDQTSVAVSGPTAPRAARS